MKQVNVFCANEQVETPHEVTIDHNDEYVFTCKCGRFLKVHPEADIKAVVQAHKKANDGQVSVEQLAKENAAKLAIFDDLLEDSDEK